MSAVLDTCLACGAALDKPWGPCPACETDQVAAAHAYRQEAARAGAASMRWKTMLPVVALGAAILGMVLMAKLGELGTGSTPTEVAYAAAVALPEDYINEAFVRAIQESELPLPVTGWRHGPDSSVVVDLAPPVAGDPRTHLWTRATREERVGYMALLAVAHNQARIAAGRAPAQRGGYPVLILAYRGSARPLAARRETGDIQLFPADR